MGTSKDRVRSKSILGNLMVILENIWNGSYFSNTVSDSSTKSRRRSERSSGLDTENISNRLQNLGKNGLSGGMDEKLPEDVSRLHNLKDMKTQEQPRTREEDFAGSSFQWVKTERAGDVSHFKEFIVENDIEYTVFQDGTRVNSTLIGDVILKHQYDSEIMSDLSSEFERVGPQQNRTQNIPQVHIPAQQAIQNSASPIIAILEKAKKKKKKIQFDLIMDLPSAEILSVLKDNFDASEDDLYNFFVAKIDKKKFVTAIIASINK